MMIEELKIIVFCGKKKEMEKDVSEESKEVIKIKGEEEGESIG